MPDFRLTVLLKLNKTEERSYRLQANKLQKRKCDRHIPDLFIIKNDSHFFR